MSRIQNQEGRKAGLHVHGVTENKPPGLLAVRPQHNCHKTKEGLYQSQQKMSSTGCVLSTEMVKALKNALMDASSTYHVQKELSKKTVCSKSRHQPKILDQPNMCQQPKCVSSSQNRTVQKKTIVHNNCANVAKKRVSNAVTKMELITRMNMEGVGGPKAPPDLDLRSPARHRPNCEMKKISETPPQNVMKTPPTRRGQRDTRRKSMTAVPGSSAEHNKPAIRALSHQTNGPTVKNHAPRGLETRKKLATVSLDRFILNRNKMLKSTRTDKIEPDMTSVDFMRKLMSYSCIGFKETRYDRRAAKSPDLDTIPEEF